MAQNLSKYYGIPTKMSDANRQFNTIAKENKNKPFYRGRYLVMKYDKRFGGMYINYLYESKPKTRYLRIKRL